VRAVTAEEWLNRQAFDERLQQTGDRPDDLRERSMPGPARAGARGELMAVRDLEYDVTTVLQSKLAAAFYDQYVQDAEKDKDQECRRLLEER